MRLLRQRKRDFAVAFGITHRAMTKLFRLLGCVFLLAGPPLFSGASQTASTQPSGSSGTSQAGQPAEKVPVTGVAIRGGHSTYRLVLPEDATEERFLQDWSPLKKLGCAYERATRRFVAIDVPPAADIYAVYKALEDGENAGRWEFEEGHCGHLISQSRPQ